MITDMDPAKAACIPFTKAEESCDESGLWNPAPRKIWKAN
jgi:hypothetical protein